MMDTTLVTFMVRTSSSTHSVDLLGSWDNFTRHYHMEPESRETKGHWRGCHQFEDIICDGDGLSGSKRTGGLKMGTKYYYYYELDGSIEYHDASKPFTTSCPFLPGQPINFIWVPVEVPPLRDGSASMSSLRSEDLKTTNPTDKYVNLRSRSVSATIPRSYTSTSILHKRHSSLLSPNLSTTTSRLNLKKKIFPNLARKCHETYMSRRLQYNVNPPKPDMVDMNRLQYEIHVDDHSLRPSSRRLTSLSSEDSDTPRKLSTLNSPPKESQKRARFSYLFPKFPIKTKKRSSSLASDSLHCCSSSSTSHSSLSSLTHRNSLVSTKSQLSFPPTTAKDLPYTSCCINSGKSSLQNKMCMNDPDRFYLSSSNYCSRPIISKNESSWQIKNVSDSKKFDGNLVADLDFLKEGISNLDSLKIEVGYLRDLIVA